MITHECHEKLISHKPKVRAEKTSFATLSSTTVPLFCIRSRRLYCEVTAKRNISPLWEVVILRILSDVKISGKYFTMMSNDTQNSSLSFNSDAMILPSNGNSDGGLDSLLLGKSVVTPVKWLWLLFSRINSSSSYFIAKGFFTQLWIHL